MVVASERKKKESVVMATMVGSWSWVDGMEMCGGNTRKSRNAQVLAVQIAVCLTMDPKPDALPEYLC